MALFEPLRHDGMFRGWKFSFNGHRIITVFIIIVVVDMKKGSRRSCMVVTSIIIILDGLVTRQW